MISEQHKKSGFTLIELLITTTLIVLLLLGISSLFMTFLIGNAKTNSKKTIKEEGVHALSQMEFIFKNARYVGSAAQPCSLGMSEIEVTSIDGGITIFKRSDSGPSGKIASNSALLTSDAVTISNGPIFDCTSTSGSKQVEIDFSLEKITPDGTETQRFNSIVNIRN